MFGLTHTRAKPGQLVGIGMTDEGLALACVTRNGPDHFSLNWTQQASYESIEQMSRQLCDWVQARNLKSCRANFALAPNQYSFVLAETPEVDAKELVDAMRWKSRELLDMEMDEVVIDCLPIPGQKSRGRQEMAYVIAADIDVLKSYAGVVEAAELALRSIDIPATVQRNVASLLPEDSQGVALLNLYQRSGLLTLTRQGEVYLARNLEVGYSHFADSDVQTDGGLQLEAMPSANQTTLDAIVLEVQRSIDYYERYFAQPPINSLVIAPMRVEVPGMVDYIASQLGLLVREMDLNVLLELPQTLSREEQSWCFPAIGAALRWPFAA